MNSVNTRAAAAPAVTQEQVAARAREVWLARGQPVGRDVEIWLEAERDLTGRSAPAAAATEAESTAVEPTGHGVVKARRGTKSLSEKVDQALEGRPGLGRGGNAKILKQTT